jgi:uncharacterized membrane protein YgcG
MRHRKKRSAAITLVLAGAVSGCSEPVPQRDVYLSQAECQRDWGQAQSCEPASDNRHSPAWYYGPAYYGRTWPSGNPRPSDNAIDAYRVDPRASALADSRRPGTASTSRPSSSSSSTWRSSSSSSSSSSGSSRGGFGSSGRSSVS